MHRILLLEPEDRSRTEIVSYLKLKDYQVDALSSAKNLMEILEKNPPDLMLMEAVFPDKDGFIVAKEVKQRTDVPIIFITGKGSESDRILGFEIGAEDYIIKPYSPKEMLLRVNAVLKRINNKNTCDEETHNVCTYWKINDLRLEMNIHHHKLYLNEREISLSATEWKILIYLMDNANTVVSREQILGACLEYKFEGYDRTVDSHIKNIRAKLGSPDWVETIRGYGYRFNGVKQ